MQEIIIGETVNFYVYSSIGKAVVEGKIVGTNGEMIKMEIDQKRYPEFREYVNVHRNDIIKEE